jgi:hypothetical protein
MPEQPDGSETTVQNAQFDAFGEPVEYAEPPASASEHSEASRWMLRAGTGLFWSLVVIIVAARATFFDPDFAGSFAHVATAIKAIFGA